LAALKADPANGESGEKIARDAIARMLVNACATTLRPCACSVANCVELLEGDKGLAETVTGRPGCGIALAAIVKYASVE
jgi:hypothetical protein